MGSQAEVWVSCRERTSASSGEAGQGRELSRTLGLKGWPFY